MLLNELCYEESSQSHHNAVWGESEPEHVVDPKQLWDDVVIKSVEPAPLGTAVIVDPPPIGFRRLLRSRSRRANELSISELRVRLDNANRHFRRKATAVLRDKDAVVLLATLYKQSNLRLDKLDICASGISLAKLAAADFCDIGSESIYITLAGREFIESVARS